MTRFYWLQLRRCPLNAELRAKLTQREISDTTCAAKPEEACHVLWHRKVLEADLSLEGPLL